VTEKYFTGLKIMEIIAIPKIIHILSKIETPDHIGEILTAINTVTAI
jgi:hypothetical protein